MNDIIIDNKTGAMLEKKVPSYIECKAVEEMAELQKELMKFVLDSPRQSLEHVAEEIAHVQLYLNTIRRLYHLPDKAIKDLMKAKLKDLQGRK